MTKRTKILIVVAALVVLACLYFFWWKKPVEQAALTVVSGGSSSGSNTPNGPALLPDSFPLQLNSAGDNVTRLQRALNALRPQNKLITDGVLGAATKDALLLTVGTSKGRLPLSLTNWNNILKMANNVG
jgi:hypothetical protein